MNRLFVTLHNVIPWKTTVLQLSLPDFMLTLPAHVILLNAVIGRRCLS